MVWRGVKTTSLSGWLVNVLLRPKALWSGNEFREPSSAEDEPVRDGWCRVLPALVFSWLDVWFGSLFIGISGLGRVRSANGITSA